MYMYLAGRADDPLLDFPSLLLLLFSGREASTIAESASVTLAVTNSASPKVDSFRLIPELAQ